METFQALVVAFVAVTLACQWWWKIPLSSVGRGIAGAATIGVVVLALFVGSHYGRRDLLVMNEVLREAAYYNFERNEAKLTGGEFVRDWKWVTVRNASEIRNVNIEYENGETCGIEKGIVMPLAKVDHNGEPMYRFLRLWPEERGGTNCPDRTEFVYKR